MFVNSDEAGKAKPPAAGEGPAGTAAIAKQQASPAGGKAGQAEAGTKREPVGGREAEGRLPFPTRTTTTTRSS